VPYLGEAGRPWHDKLLTPSAFLRERSRKRSPPQPIYAEAFAMTGFFLSRHVLEPARFSQCSTPAAAL